MLFCLRDPDSIRGFFWFARLLGHIICFYQHVEKHIFSDPASQLVGTHPSEMKTPEGSKDEGTGCLLTRLMVKETWKQSEHQQGWGRLGELHMLLRKIYLTFTNQVSV